eukprot:1145439-Pelagomonas_calceolata.AAC.1
MQGVHVPARSRECRLRSRAVADSMLKLVKNVRSNAGNGSGEEHRRVHGSMQGVHVPARSRECRLWSRAVAEFVLVMVSSGPAMVKNTRRLLSAVASMSCESQARPMPSEVDIKGM